MAELAALRQALVRIGFTNPAAQYITDLNGGGLNTLDSFRYFTDTQVNDLCDTVRRPGGMIPNPAPAAGAPAQVPNRGIPVSAQACSNLKLMCYMLRFKHNTRRPVVPVDINVDSIGRLREHKQWEENHEDPAAPEINFQEGNWPRIMEAIDEYLRNCLGTTGVPLAYVVRTEAEVPAAAGDPDNWTAEISAKDIFESLC